ncbi:MAG: casein kinase 1 family protein [candidate division WOR-3 bacterium]
MDSDHIMINGQYVLGRQLGMGSFGEIFSGINIMLPNNSPDKLVAVKVESKHKNIQLLKKEAQIYKYLYKENMGIPKMYWFGVQDEYNVLVLEMLGPNLESLFSLCNRHFTLKTVIMIAQALIKIIHYVHAKGIIHRDIKPENFLIGLTNNQIYLIDYGLSKTYKNSDNSHIEMSTNKKLIGTVRYASINSHKGLELSRRDDLESIGYILIYFMKGKLPWQGLPIKTSTQGDKYRAVYEAKKNITNEQLCQGLPKEFKLYMDYVKSLDFDEKPNYKFLHSLFNQLFTRENYVYDYKYDWNTKIKRK